MECGSGSKCVSTTGPKIGSEPLLMCGPNDANGCKTKDDNKHCLCDTDLCNKQLQSSAGRFVSYWSLITFAVIISVY